MKKKKFIVVFLFITFAHLLFSQDLLLLKEFNIKGKKELKKVKMIERNEFCDINKPVMYSKDGRVTNLLFYDDDLLIKEWESTSYNDNGLYWYDFNPETNLFNLKVNDSYKETLYFYDEEKRLVRKAVTGTEEFCNYFYNQDGNLIKTETEQLAAENKFNSKNQLIHIKFSNGEKKYYKYDRQNRITYKKEVYKDKNIYEYFFTYDDENHTKSERKIKKNRKTIVFDFTDFYQYDSDGNIIYTKYYSSITTDSDNKLLSFAITEEEYEYDEKGYLSHIKKTSSGKEKNKYFEYLFDENDNLKTSVCYEEVE